MIRLLPSPNSRLVFLSRGNIEDALEKLNVSARSTLTAPFVFDSCL